MANRCWEELDLSNYVRTWFNSTTCSDHGFGKCFLFLSDYPWIDPADVRGSPSDSGSAFTMPVWQPRVNPKAYYVAYNIFAISKFFRDWYTMLDNHWSIICEQIRHLADLLGPRYSPPASNGYNKFDIESLEIAMLGLVTLPSAKSAFHLTGLDNATQDFALKLNEALVMSPTLRQHLHPRGINRSTQLSIDPLELFPRFTNALSRINDSLILTMSTPENFLAFAGQQEFSQATAPLPKLLPNEVFYGLYTYIFSTIGSDYGVEAVVARDTSPVDLATNATSKTLAYPVACQGGLNAQGVCDAWWYSADENAAYGLNDVWRMGHQYGANLTKAFSSFTSGQYLFENAYACKDQQPSSNGVPAITIYGDHFCISQFPMRVWNMGCQDPKDTACEFLDHPAQHNFLGKCKNGGKCVPDSYMGPLLKQQKQKITRY